MIDNSTLNLCLNQESRNYYVFQPLIADQARFQAIAIPITILNIVLGVYIIVSNAVIIDFYRTKCKPLVPFLYVSLAGNDLATGIIALLHALLVILILSHYCAHSLDVLITSSSFLTMWVVRIAAYFNVILACIRAFHILKPLSKIRKRFLVLFMFTVPVFPWVALIAYQMHVDYLPDLKDDMTAFRNMVITSSSRVGEIVIHGMFGRSHSLPIIFCVVIPFLLPAALTLCSLCVQLQPLLTRYRAYSPPHDNGAEYSSHSTSALNREEATALFGVNAVFALCNTTMAVFWMTCCLWVFEITTRSVIWIYVVSVTLRFVNAALTPTVLIAANSEIKERLRGYWRSQPDSQAAAKASDTETTTPVV